MLNTITIVHRNMILKTFFTAACFDITSKIILRFLLSLCK